MISMYLNQEAVWLSTTGLNDYGEPITVESTIKCRFEYNRRLIRNKQGIEVVSEAKVWTKAAIGPADAIQYDGRDWPVMSVAKCVDLMGDFSHYEVRL